MSVPLNDVPVVCFPFAGGQAGGSHVSACKLIQSLDRSRFRPLVLVHRGGGDVARLLRDEGIAFEPAPRPDHFGRAYGVVTPSGVRGLVRATAAQPALARFLRQRRVRILHSNEGAMHVTWALPARLAGARFVWHHRGSPDARALRWLAPLAADELVAVSRFALSGAEGVGDRQRTRRSVIYSPFDTEAVVADRSAEHRRALMELGLAEGTRIIGYFGNIIARKRPLLFVDVIAELARIAPDLPVVGLMFGAAIEPELEAQVTARAAMAGVGDRIRLMGFRYPATRWIAACDVHAVTAVDEPFGRSLIEAMLLGTPVVAVACGGNVEAVRDGVTGRLTPPGDAVAMARALAALLRNPAQSALLAGQARRDALARFGHERHGDAVMRVYDRALGDSRPVG